MHLQATTPVTSICSQHDVTPTSHLLHVALHTDDIQDGTNLHYRPALLTFCSPPNCRRRSLGGFGCSVGADLWLVPAVCRVERLPAKMRDLGTSHLVDPSEYVYNSDMQRTYKRCHRGQKRGQFTHSQQEASWYRQSTGGEERYS